MRFLRFYSKKWSLLGAKTVGKTTRCLNLFNPANLNDSAYYNWDNPKDQKVFRSAETKFSSKLLVSNELHNYFYQVLLGKKKFSAVIGLVYYNPQSHCP
jgi:hypothetical protein